MFTYYTHITLHIKVLNFFFALHPIVFPLFNQCAIYMSLLTMPCFVLNLGVLCPVFFITIYLHQTHLFLKAPPFITKIYLFNSTCITKLLHSLSLFLGCFMVCFKTKTFSCTCMYMSVLLL